jgi:hypothetical protein
MFPITIRHSRILVMHCMINIQDEKDHPAIQQCTAPQCSSVNGEDSEEWLGTCPPFTLLFRPSLIWLQSADGHKGSDMQPASHLLSFMNCWNTMQPAKLQYMVSFIKCWNRFLLQADIQTSRMMAKLHWFGWGFSREVHIVNKFHLYMVFSYSYHYLIMQLICSWCTVWLSYVSSC